MARVQAIVADPAYAGKTIGVVSLLSGSGQAAYLQHRLREVDRAPTSWSAVRCGSATRTPSRATNATSCSSPSVVSTADGGIGAFTKRDFHRRVNVAASRARDQMVVFHSVRPNELNADDARALLLSYALRPAAAEDTVAPERALETDFQRAVLHRLVDAGLQPVPQFRIGGFRIDFVVNAPDGRRLAVECDGERFHGAETFARDLRRQAILERVGNCVFVRLRASLFHRDPDAAMAPVWRRAEELGLSPRLPATAV